MFKLLLLCSIYLVKLSCSSFVPTPAQKIPNKCTSSCLTPYGAVLGTFDGVPGYSNCNDECINFDDEGVSFAKNETGFIGDVYVGVRWQCVEYARRYLITKRHVTFDSVDAAYQIFNLPCLTDLTSEKTFARFLGYKNGASQYPPIVGDLLIFAKTNDAPYGHVAVVAGVNVEKGYVEIAEQNINMAWEKPDLYSRRIAIFLKKGVYNVQETKWNERTVAFCQKKANEVIGWKRVGEFRNTTSAHSMCP